MIFKDKTDFMKKKEKKPTCVRGLSLKPLRSFNTKNVSRHNLSTKSRESLKSIILSFEGQRKGRGNNVKYYIFM